MIMTESIAALVFPILFMVMLLHIVKGLLGKQRIESGGGTPERQDTVVDNAEMIPDGNQSDDLGFEIPRMRHAPRIERQGGVYQGDVYHETKAHGTGNISDNREACQASERGSFIYEGGRRCSGETAPSEYSGARPIPAADESPIQKPGKDGLLTAREMRAAIIASEVLGKPKALRKR